MIILQFSLQNRILFTARQKVHLFKKTWFSTNFIFFKLNKQFLILSALMLINIREPRCWSYQQWPRFALPESFSAKLQIWPQKNSETSCQQDLLSAVACKTHLSANKKNIILIIKKFKISTLNIQSSEKISFLSQEDFFS